MCRGAPIQSTCEPNLKQSESEKGVSTRGRVKRNGAAWQLGKLLNKQVQPRAIGANFRRQSSARVSLAQASIVDRALQTLQRLDVSCLQTLRAALRFEANLLILNQRLEAVAADFGEVRE